MFDRAFIYHFGLLIFVDFSHIPHLAFRAKMGTLHMIKSESFHSVYSSVINKSIKIVLNKMHMHFDKLRDIKV